MFSIDKLSRIPVYEQLIAEVEKMILTGVLKPDELIPSVRSLSLELDMNPNTIQKAYNDLERRQVTYSVPGRGRFVSPRALEILSDQKLEKLEELEKEVYDYAIGGVPMELVMKAVKDAYEQAENDLGKRDSDD